MKTTRLWWVRHGPTHQKTFTGWRDVPADLSDTAKLERLNAHLPNDAALVSSDLLRARQTADALSGNRKRMPHDRRFRELNFGAWDGQHFSQVAKTHPELSRAYWETPGDIQAPDGESWNDLHARLTPALDELLTGFVGQDIIVVAHMGVILSQVERALGVTPYEAMSHAIDPLSVSRIDVTSDRWTSVSINHQP